MQKKIKDEAGVSEVMSKADAVRVVNDMKGLSLFEGVDTQVDMHQYLVEKGGLVMPEKLVFRKEQVLHNNKLIEVDADFGYEVDFLRQLERQLNADGVLHWVDNPREFDPSIFRSILDGDYYRNHPVFLMDSKAIVVYVYHDGIELVDSTSSRTGEYNTTQFYWVLGNIPPELRSKDSCINLYASVFTKHLKIYKYEKVLENLTNAMNKLASPEGATLKIDGKDRVFHGFIGCICGDTPASAAIAGVKESVAAAKPCRICLCDKCTHLQITDVNMFELRNKESHEQHIAEVERYNLLSAREKGAMQDPSVKYGVNNRSPLLKIIHMDVTKCLPQDLMHLGHEGALELVSRLLINHIVTDKKKISLDVVNERILEYSKYLPRDRPSTIKPDHLTKTLRQSAAQMISLARLLPFILRVQDEQQRWTFPGDSKYLDCFLSFMKVLNLCLAYVLKREDARRLEVMVKVFHEQLLVLVPLLRMSKVHYFHHFGQMMLLFGVIRQFACFRFEAHHAFFKRLIKILHNFVNVLLTLSMRHQTRQCRLMMNENYLYDGHKVTVKKEIIGFDPNANRVQEMFPGCQKITEISRLTMHGTVFKEKTVILLSESPPEFALITHMYRIDDGKNFGFVCQRLTTVGLDASLGAFEVTSAASKVTVDALRLIFPHEIISLRSEGKAYVIPVGHRTLLSS